MKIKRKIIFFVALMSLFYCVSFMQDTYAKYVSSATSSANLTIARWNVLINNQDVIENSDFSDTITPTFSGTTNIKSGVIAPTAEGSFDVTLNGEDTDVSFTYTISINESSNNTVSDLVITRYVVDGVEYQYNNSITENILFNAQDKTREFTFYVKWNDNEQTQNMNNAQDTQAANSGIAAFDVNINVIQMQ